MADASGAIDAAVEAAASVIPVDPDDGTCIVDYQPDGIPLWGTPQSLANVIVHAAVPVLLAAECERIARELEKAAEGGLIFTGTGHEVELLKAGSQARAHAFRDAAAIARGSVAGKPDTQGGGRG